MMIIMMIMINNNLKSLSIIPFSYLLHQQMNISMAMRLKLHMTILLRSNLTLGILQSRDSILLHNRHILLLQAIIVHLLQKSNRTKHERHFNEYDMNMI